MQTQKTKFSSQADPGVIAMLKQIAGDEGRQLQAVLDEALRDFIEKKKSGKLRRPVMDALQHSMQEFDALYKELAK